MFLEIEYKLSSGYRDTYIHTYIYICGNESVASLVASLNGRCLRITQKQKNAVKEIPSDSGYEVSGTRRKFRWKR